MAEKSPSAIAYSYVRFSTPEQAAGDSLRRQTDAAVAWCERNGCHLDTSTTLRDLGKSAYTGEHRKNPDRHALAAFLKLVEAGKIPRGSYLVIENLDRLSREDERAALRLWMDLLDAGINIVQLQPETIFRHEKSDMFDIMRAVMELSRGHGESARKSERNGAAWQAKIERARAGQRQLPRKDGRITKSITGRTPLWIEERNGDFHLIAARAAVVKRIFRMAATGHGIASIVKHLTAENIPAFGGREAYTDAEGKTRYRASGSGRYASGVWVRAYVARILKDRRALGEFQPCGPDRRPVGDPIKDHFPAAVTEAEWFAAKAGLDERRRKPGRVGEHINLFAGLIRNARDGDSFISVRRGATVGGGLLFLNSAGADCRTRQESFPAETLEAAVLNLLREIDPQEILNGKNAPDESLVLAGELATTEERIAALEAELIDGDVAPLARVLRQLEERRRDLAARLAQARQKAVHPLSESWGETQTLAGVLASATDKRDVRLRLRSALRRIIDEIRLLVVPRGRDRLAALQIWFHGGDRRQRSILIRHVAPWGGRWAVRKPGGWRAWSLASIAADADLDLRNHEDAQALAAVLEEVDLACLES